MRTSETTAICNAEQAYEDDMSRWLDNLTDYDDGTNLIYDLRDRYQQKHNFLVMEMDASTWVICSSSPCFFEGGPLVDHLHHKYFATVEIDDDHHLLVTLKRQYNSIDDENYIAESFDAALDWLPEWEATDAAYHEFMAAKKKYEQFHQALIRA